MLIYYCEGELFDNAESAISFASTFVTGYVNVYESDLTFKESEEAFEQDRQALEQWDKVATGWNGHFDHSAFKGSSV